MKPYKIYETQFSSYESLKPNNIYFAKYENMGKNKCAMNTASLEKSTTMRVRVPCKHIESGS